MNPMSPVQHYAFFPLSKSGLTDKILFGEIMEPNLV